LPFAIRSVLNKNLQVLEYAAGRGFAGWRGVLAGKMGVSLSARILTRTGMR